ncbi:MAG: sulfur oxidation c-type cytochrome SoxX [Sphingomonadaceae bacterium]
MLGLPPRRKSGVKPGGFDPGSWSGVLLAGLLASALAQAAPPLLVVGDGIPVPLSALAGDAARGRAIVANRQLGLCLLCHSGPIPEQRFQGNLAPPLDGAGGRWSAAQLRLRIADASHLNPDTIMPAYFNTSGLRQVAPAQQGKTIFDAQQVEDVVAWLQTLRTP